MSLRHRNLLNKCIVTHVSSKSTNGYCRQIRAGTCDRAECQCRDRKQPIQIRTDARAQITNVDLRNAAPVWRATVATCFVQDSYIGRPRPSQSARSSKNTPATYKYAPPEIHVRYSHRLRTPIHAKYWVKLYREYSSSQLLANFRRNWMYPGDD